MKNLKNKEGLLFVNVASSTFMLEGFVNLDNHPFFLLARLGWLGKNLVPRRNRELFLKYARALKGGVHVRHDCRRPLPFEPNTVDHVLSSHFLEHLYPDEAHAAIADYWRILRPGGTIHLIVPDLRRMAREYLEESESNSRAGDAFVEKTILSRTNRGSLKYRALEFVGGFGLQHRWMYDEQSLWTIARSVGFVPAAREAMPSAEFRDGDGSVHIFAMRPIVAKY